MTKKKIINNKKYYTCGRCKHENTPYNKYPCVSCIYGTGYGADLWELKQQPCDDAVSRKAVLDTLDKMDKALDDDRSVESYKILLAECYKDLPPVTPKESEVKMNMSNFEDIKAYDVPTNGSIFLKTYPDLHISNIAYDDGVCYVYVDLGGSRIRFTSDWWNATYKEACRTERN